MKDSSPIKGETAEEESQEELWKEVARLVLDFKDIHTVMKRFILTRNLDKTNKDMKTKEEILTPYVWIDRHLKANVYVGDALQAMEEYANQKLEDYRRLSSDHEEALAESYAKLQVMYGEKCAELNRLSSKEDKSSTLQEPLSTIEREALTNEFKQRYEYEYKHVLADLVDILYDANGTGSGAAEILEYIKSKFIRREPSPPKEE